MKQKISVVIVNFNAGPGLVDAVRAAIVDAHEVVIVDNASSDGSLEMLESIFGDSPKMRIVRNPTNQGFAKACNRGVSIASADFVFFLNPDCELEPGAMACLLDAMQADAEVGMVGGLLLNPDGTEQAGGRRAVPTPWRSFVRAFGLGRFSKRWQTASIPQPVKHSPPAAPISTRIPCVRCTRRSACSKAAQRQLHKSRRRARPMQRRPINPVTKIRGTRGRRTKTRAWAAPTTPANPSTNSSACTSAANGRSKPGLHGWVRFPHHRRVFRSARHREILQRRSHAVTAVNIARPWQPARAITAVTQSPYSRISCDIT